jgi:hypothetical protein
MTPSDKVEMRDMDSFATSMPLQSAQGMGIQCSAAEAREGLQCILNMAKEPNTTSNLEACKILCDFTQDDSLVQAICDCGAVEILGGFLSAPCEWTKQHAIVAIANLSDKAICQVHTRVMKLVMLCINAYMTGVSHIRKDFALEVT